MITLRNFDAGDCEFLCACFRPGMTAGEAMSLVDEWDQKSYKGSYFEQFAICSDAQPVGWISLYAPNAPTVGVGFEVIEHERRKGYCYQAVALVLEYAKNLGYKTAFSQVRKNNAASIGLHEKCGFAVTGEGVSRHGNAVYLYEKSLGDNLS